MSGPYYVWRYEADENAEGKSYRSVTQRFNSHAEMAHFATTDPKGTQGLYYCGEQMVPFTTLIEEAKNFQKPFAAKEVEFLSRIRNMLQEGCTCPYYLDIVSEVMHAIHERLIYLDTYDVTTR